MRWRGVQNEVARFAGVESRKREKLEKYGTGKYFPVFSVFPVLPKYGCCRERPAAIKLVT